MMVYGYIFIYHIPFEFHIKSVYFNSDSAENMGNTLCLVFSEPPLGKFHLNPQIFF